jgi:hypothetical protein
MPKLKRVLMTMTLSVSLVLFAQNAQASCSYSTYTHNGQVIMCTTCCYNGNQCYTNCH